MNSILFYWSSTSCLSSIYQNPSPHHRIDSVHSITRCFCYPLFLFFVILHTGRINYFIRSLPALYFWHVMDRSQFKKLLRWIVADLRWVSGPWYRRPIDLKLQDYLYDMQFISQSILINFSWWRAAASSPTPPSAATAPFVGDCSRRFCRSRTCSRSCPRFGRFG